MPCYTTESSLECLPISLVPHLLCQDLVLDCNMGNNAPNASFVARHKPSFLVLASQVSAAFIHAIVKILETGERPVHPFQILQIRLLITGISCMLYLWYRGTSDFPLGPKDVRPLLVVRAVGGVCGAIGFYCMRFSPDSIGHFSRDEGLAVLIESKFRSST